MKKLAIIHAGPAAPTLKMLITALDCVGVREKYFMGDLIEALHDKETFDMEMRAMVIELVYGQYFHKSLADVLVFEPNPEQKDLASEFLQATANASEQVSKYLHETLVNQGRYNNDGKFPYEFDSFDGKLIYLREL